MPATDSNLDSIFISRDEQVQHFCQLLQHWQEILQTTSTTSTVVGLQSAGQPQGLRPYKWPSNSQSCQPPSPHHKIQGPVVLLFGESGLGKSTLLKRYHMIASEPGYHLKVTNIVDWRLVDEVDSRQFAGPSCRETDALPYFNMLHLKLAAALSKRPGEFNKQLSGFVSYKQSVAEVRVVRERVADIVFKLHLDKVYEALAVLTRSESITFKLLRWCFERAWPECDEAQISELLTKYIGENTGIQKKHLSVLLDALQNNLSKEELQTYLYPERILACALGRDLLSKTTRRQTLLVFFDTYERIAGGDFWLRHVMSAASQRVGWVIAGQADAWSNKDNSDIFQMRDSYQTIVPEDRLLAVDFTTSHAGVFSVENIMDYFFQLCKQQPALKSISRADAERIFDITQGNPQVVNNIASSYAYRPDLNSILEKAEHDMIELYFANTQNDEQERQKLYGLAMLRRVNNVRVVTGVPGLDLQHDQYTYGQMLQQLHNRYQFIAVEQGQPLLHEKVRDHLRRWLLAEGRKTSGFTVVAERLLAVQQSQLDELELQHHYRSLPDYLEDDGWVNVYLDFIEASFWFNPETGILLALAFLLAAMLYRPDKMYEIEHLSSFFINAIPAFYRDLWQRLTQCLLANDYRTEPGDVLFTGVTELHKQLAQMAASPHSVPSFGQKMDYERGLDYLRQRVSGTDSYRELLAYEARLRENLRHERSFGSSETIRSERSVIIGEIDQLAKDCGVSSFKDLCRTQGGFPAAYVGELRGALWWLQGKIYHEYAKNDPSMALMYYHEAFKYLSDHSVLQEDLARTYWEMASYHFNREQYLQCITCLDEALKVKYDYVDAYYSRGNALYELERYEEAVVQYQYVFCLYEQYLPAFINLGNAYAELKRYEDALVEYDLACKLDPQNYLPYYNRGCTYAELKRYREALQDFTQAIGLNADCAEAYIRRGNVYGWLRDYKNARADYQRAAEVDPQEISNAWMAMWADFDRTVIGSEAQEQLEKLISLAPEHYIAHICRAICMALQRQKLNDIEPVLEQASLQEPEQCDAYFWKGVILAFYGQTEAARKNIDQALDLGLPPLLLMPLYWLEHVKPNFFNTYARPLLKKHALLVEYDL